MRPPPSEFVLSGLGLTAALVSAVCFHAARATLIIVVATAMALLGRALLRLLR